MATGAEVWDVVATHLRLTSALERLEAGDTNVRLPIEDDPDSARQARAFNALAERLAAAESAPAVSTTAVMNTILLLEGLDVPTLETRAYVAIMGAAGFSRLRQHIGAAMAERILRAAAERIRRHMPGARIGRVGRTNLEFAFTAVSDSEAENWLLELKDISERRLEIDGQSFDLEVAFGFASRDACGDAVIECAASALAQAQTSPVKVLAFREEDRLEADARLALLGDLRLAIGRGELALAYQPKLSTRNDRIEVAEALLRWTHPQRGPIPPDSFIGLAEETGLIADLTRWVLERAIADQSRLARAGHPLEIHINLSGRLVADTDFADWLMATVRRDAVGAIGLEITETAVIDDPQTALDNLQAFADAGLKIAIDDYGSGLSSLAYLKQLPAHELKIDKMFISGLGSSPRDPLLVRSTIDLAHALGMEVTAEGVETEIELGLLRMMGCDLIQGYLISRPLDLNTLKTFLDTFAAAPATQVNLQVQAG